MRLQPAQQPVLCEHTQVEAAVEFVLLSSVMLAVADMYANIFQVSPASVESLTKRFAGPQMFSSDMDRCYSIAIALSD